MTDVVSPVSLDKNSVHVLIVSVGRYGNDAFPDLPGASRTADRLAKFWLDCELAGDRTLGSLQMLVSEAKPTDEKADDRRPVKFEVPEGRTLEIEAARIDPVKVAMSQWAQRCRDTENALGILHWIGHGEMTTNLDEGTADADTLYTEDQAENAFGQRDQNGINWRATEKVLNQQVPAQMVCFIDACRSHQGKHTAGLTQPFGPMSFPDDELRSRAVVFQAFRDKSGPSDVKTFCAHPDKKVENGIEGGALLSEAIRLTLGEFGAIRQRDSGFAVHCATISEAANHRIERWRRVHGDLSEMSAIRQTEVNMRHNFPVTVPRNPKGMVDLGHPPSVSCTIESRNGVLHLESDPGRYWDLDLAHGDYSARLDREGAAPKSIPVRSPHCVEELS